MSGAVRDNPFQPKGLSVLREVVALSLFFVGQTCKLALQLQECLLADLRFEGEFQFSAERVRFGMKIVGVVWHGLDFLSVELKSEMQQPRGRRAFTRGPDL